MIRFKKGTPPIVAALLLAHMPADVITLIEKAQAKQDFQRKAYAWFNRRRSLRG